MRIHLLGTGTSQGVPVIGCTCAVCTSKDTRDARLRSCAVIEDDGVFLLIDTGPDLRQQMLKAAIPRVDAILYTHEHNDHVIGLDDIRPYNFAQKSDLPVYGLPRVVEEVKSRFHYAFAENWYPGAPRAVAYSISGEESINLHGVDVLPIQVMHGRLPILGYRFGKIAFITDASHIDMAELDKLRDLDVLVINALRHEQHPAHFNLAEALAVIKEVSPRRSYITHVSHYMDKYENWAKSLPADVYAAYDGLVVEV